MFYRVRFVIMFILHLYQYIFKFRLPQKNTSLFFRLFNRKWIPTFFSNKCTNLSVACKL